MLALQRLIFIYMMEVLLEILLEFVVQFVGEVLLEGILHAAWQVALQRCDVYNRDAFVNLALL